MAKICLGRNRHIMRLVILTTLALTLGGCVTTLPKLADAFWQDQMRESPVWATYLGDRRYDDNLPDLSFAAEQGRRQKLQEFLKSLEAIDQKSLSFDDQVTYEVLEHELKSGLLSDICQTHLWSVDHLNGPQVWLLELPNHHTVRDANDLETLKARYKKSRELFEQHVQNLKLGMQKGLTPYRHNVELVIEQIRDMKDTPISEGLNLYKDFLKDTLLAAARTEPGINAACYKALISKYTGTTLAPEEIHRMGLAEVARIKSAKKKGSSARYAKSREALIQHNTDLVERATAELSKVFSKIPKTPIYVKEMEAFREKTSPAAYYYQAPQDGSRPAYYYLNTHDFQKRPLGNMAALAFHEAVPGHHLQVGLQNENQHIPEFQRQMGQTAFVEGWALYAEKLAGELDLYKTVDEKMGALDYELWRALRLVVDTGIHAMGWSREKAIVYLAGESSLPRHEVVNEIDRYITWPGQALAYKIGEMTISNLRAKAKEQLKDHFDIKQFHDVVLSHGAVPLSTLTALVERYIATSHESDPTVLGSNASRHTGNLKGL